MGQHRANIERNRREFIRSAAHTAAGKLLRMESDWNRKTASDAKRRVKYQGSLTIEEAAELESVRKALCPEMSRYEFVRTLLLEFVAVGWQTVKNIERTCCR